MVRRFDLRKRIISMLVLIMSILLVGCQDTVWLEDIVIPYKCIYNVNITSISADDIDLNLIVGRGIDIGGTRGYYVYKMDGNTYYNDNRDDVVRLDNGEVIASREYVGDYVVTLINDILGDYTSAIAVRSIELVDESKYYVFRFSPEKSSDDYLIEVSMFVDINDYKLHGANIALSDELNVNFNIENSEQYLVDYGTDSIISGKSATESLSDIFVNKNVYTYGKYELVNKIIDKYSGWLGGNL